MRYVSRQHAGAWQVTDLARCNRVVAVRPTRRLAEVAQAELVLATMIRAA